MNYARVKLSIIWRFFFGDRKVFTSRLQRLYNDWARLFTTWNRPAKMRSSLNGALGIKLTDSPLAHGVTSVLLPQPGTGLALIYVGMVSGSDWWKDWNEIQEHLLHTCAISSHKGLCVREARAFQCPAPALLLQCSAWFLDSRGCLPHACVVLPSWRWKAIAAQNPIQCECCIGPAHWESWYIL